MQINTRTYEITNFMKVFINLAFYSTLVKEIRTIFSKIFHVILVSLS